MHPVVQPCCVNDPLAGSSMEWQVDPSACLFTCLAAVLSTAEGTLDWSNDPTLAMPVAEDRAEFGET